MTSSTTTGPETGWITKYTAPDEPATVDAVQFWADLPGKHHYAPTRAETQSTQAAAPNLFMTGRIAMYLEYTGFLNQYAKITDFEWGIAAWPHASGSQYPMHHGAWMDQWAIFKAAKNLEGSWEFLKYIASPEGQTITDVKRGSPSARKSLGQAWVNFWREQIPKLDPKQINVAVEAMSLDSLTPDNWSVNFSPLDGKVLAASARQGRARPAVGRRRAQGDQAADGRRDRRHAQDDGLHRLAAGRCSTPPRTPAPKARRGPMARREELAFYLFASPWLIGFVLLTAGPMLGSLVLASPTTT